MDWLNIRGLRRANSRRGFTLVELLVVMSVIGILVAMLIPAVQAVRGAARKTQCSNNLRQIGLGIANYEAANRKFPPGQSWVSRRPPNDFSYSWSAQILGFLEEQDIKDGLDMKKPFVHPHNLPVAAQVIPIFLCPATSLREAHRNGEDQLYNIEGVGNGLACTDFLGIAGPSKESANFATGLNYGPQRGVLIGPNGLMNGDVLKEPPPIRTKNITDGLSKTAAVTECAGRGLDKDGDFHGTWVSGKNIAHIAKTVNSTKPPKAWTDEQVYAQHWGGAHFLFCDGSLHFMGDDVGRKIIKAICSRNGDEAEGDLF